MKRIVIAAIAVCLLVGAAFVWSGWSFFSLMFAGITGGARTRLLPQSDVDSVVGWAAQQHLTPGKAQTLHLPANLAAFTADGKVIVAKTKDGRTCALLIEAWGYKDNFDGILGCDAPLHGDEVVKSANYAGRTYVSIEGSDIFEELYVSSKRNDSTYDVFFDLN